MPFTVVQTREKISVQDVTEAVKHSNSCDKETFDVPFHSKSAIDGQIIEVLTKYLQMRNIHLRNFQVDRTVLLNVRLRLRLL